eukprot:gene19212-25829_t
MYVNMHMQAIAYLFLAIYLDHTLPSSNGRQAYTWYYFFQPSYWMPSRSKGSSLPYALEALNRFQQDAKDGSMGSSLSYALEALPMSQQDSLWGSSLPYALEALNRVQQEATDGSMGSSLPYALEALNRFQQDAKDGSMVTDEDVLEEAEATQRQCFRYCTQHDPQAPLLEPRVHQAQGPAGQAQAPLNEISDSGMYSRDISNGVAGIGGSTGTDVLPTLPLPTTDSLSPPAEECDLSQGLHMFGLRKVYRRSTSLSDLFNSLWQWFLSIPSWFQSIPSWFRSIPSWWCRCMKKDKQQHEETTANPQAECKEDSTNKKKERDLVAVAVQGNWLSIPAGQCFALLGPNGAGKTTTFNCLTGAIPPSDGDALIYGSSAIPPSAGDALIYGNSVRTPAGQSRIRSIMGVCPQFDVLWSELTGREHLDLFGVIKGLSADPRQPTIHPLSQSNPLPSKETDNETATGRFSVQEMLRKVGLDGVASNRRTSTYSGGMKRRLSVAMALMGDPQVVFLDDPTSGMDPISKRQVWDLLVAYKKDRVLVLTTHSMEEAEMLGDRIGIFVSGQLRCLGSSLHLKSRFGSGYKLSVCIPPKKAGQSVLEPSSPTNGGFHSSASTSDINNREARANIKNSEDVAGQSVLEPSSSTDGGLPSSASTSDINNLEARANMTGSEDAAPLGCGATIMALIQSHLKPECAVDSSGLALAPTLEVSVQGSYWHFLVPPEYEGVLPALFRELETVQGSYWHFLIPPEYEGVLPSFRELEERSEELGVADIQIGMTSLEEVFLNVAKPSGPEFKPYLHESESDPESVRPQSQVATMQGRSAFPVDLARFSHPAATGVASSPSGELSHHTAAHPVPVPPKVQQQSSTVAVRVHPVVGSTVNHQRHTPPPKSGITLQKSK